MIKQVRRSGNSLVITLDRTTIKLLKIKEGTYVNMTIRPVTAQELIDLK